MKKLSKEVAKSIIKAEYKDLVIIGEEMTFKKVILTTSDGVRFTYLEELNWETGKNIIVLTDGGERLILNIDYVSDNFDMDGLKKGESLRIRTSLADFIEKNRWLLK